MAYCPPSDFRVNVEAGLRTAFSVGLAFLWLGLGPHSNRLSFFAGVSSIICVGNSAGQTIARFLVSGCHVLLLLLLLVLPCCCCCCRFGAGAVAVAVDVDVASLLYQSSRRRPNKLANLIIPPTKISKYRPTRRYDGVTTTNRTTQPDARSILQ